VRYCTTALDVAVSRPNAVSARKPVAALIPLKANEDVNGAEIGTALSGRASTSSSAASACGAASAHATKLRIPKMRIVLLT
jgi:hypothetical protein